uniref:Alpha 1,4-glycosyltransferase domain-containing protein n=1 Tax=Palpitomonas bilix TaxID=652834 RepID=A0A7S3LVE3_9EUKA|mmetsp:Transcript_49284/g.127098  ORF Transcript_49284/g.127098 Transcript_49284/m.127098 type:complete len:229 (+) Transcript_49284:2-688(+)
MKAEPPMQLGGKPLRLAAHQSDAWRMKVLSRLGGLYLDWDVIVQRDIFALLKSDFTLGMERFDNALGVAVIASTPDAKFLNIWQKEMEARFNPECYTCHSVTAVREIARDNPLQVDLLHWKRFYYPGWEDEAMGALIDWRVRGVTLEDLRERPALPENGPRLPSLSLDATFCLHLFESHANAVKRLGDRSHSLISHQRIWSHPSPSPFEVMARAILEHLDEGKRKEEL